MHLGVLSFFRLLQLSVPKGKSNILQIIHVLCPLDYREFKICHIISFEGFETTGHKEHTDHQHRVWLLQERSCPCGIYFWKYLLWIHVPTKVVIDLNFSRLQSGENRCNYYMFIIHWILVRYGTSSSVKLGDEDAIILVK